MVATRPTSSNFFTAPSFAARRGLVDVWRHLMTDASRRTRRAFLQVAIRVFLFSSLWPRV